MWRLLSYYFLQIYYFYPLCLSFYLSLPSSFTFFSYISHFDVWMCSIAERHRHLCVSCVAVTDVHHLITDGVVVKREEEETLMHGDTTSLLKDQRARREIEGLSWQQQRLSGRPLHLRMLWQCSVSSPANSLLLPILLLQTQLWGILWLLRILQILLWPVQPKFFI